MNKLSLNFIKTNEFFFTWQEFITKSTTNLVDALYKITGEELEILYNPSIRPFIPLETKHEYILQIFLNAFNDKSNSKYATVLKSNVYFNLFETWFNILNLIKVHIETCSNETILTYVKSNVLYNYIALQTVISNFTLSSKISKYYETKPAYELNPIPNATIFVYKN